MGKYFKAVVYALSFLLCCCQAHADMGHCSKELHGSLPVNIDNKFYVEPGTIYISPNEILLNLSGQFLPIKNLHSDSEGVFVLVEEILSAKAVNSDWRCAHCGEWNSGGNFCRVCQKPRKEMK